MFTPQLVRVESAGEHVKLAIGNWERSLYFETAFLLASWMDECAREAKEWTGNTRKGLKGIGTLHDASNPNWLNAGQPFTPNGVPIVNRDVLKREQIAVRSDAGMVVIKFGGTEAMLPYQATLTISQWIRLRAKESQMRAGDLSRHWSKVVAEHDLQHGPGVTRG